MIDPIQFPAAKAKSAGVVTFPQYMTAPNGARVIAVWSPRWEILTDKDMPIEAFRSTEKWTAFALDAQGDVRWVIPGCQVKAWAQADVPPAVRSDCWVIEP